MQELFRSRNHRNKNKTYKYVYDSHVIKVGSDLILRKEYQVSLLVSELKVPTFIRYTYDMSGLIMPFYYLGNIEKYTWDRNNFDILKNVIQHVCCSMIYAFTMIQFVHRDIHLANILLTQTTREYIQYGDFSVPCMGILPVIVDFDRSDIDTSSEGKHIMFEDIIRVMILLSCELNVRFETSSIFPMLDTYRNSTDTDISNLYTSLCTSIDTFSIRYISQ